MTRLRAVVDGGGRGAGSGNGPASGGSGAVAAKTQKLAANKAAITIIATAVLEEGTHRDRLLLLGRPARGAVPMRIGTAETVGGAAVAALSTRSRRRRRCRTRAPLNTRGRVRETHADAERQVRLSFGLGPRRPTSLSVRWLPRCEVRRCRRPHPQKTHENPHTSLCSLTRVRHRTDPVMVPDGHSYEHSAILSVPATATAKPARPTPLLLTFYPNLALARIRDHEEDMLRGGRRDAGDPACCTVACCPVACGPVACCPASAAE